MVSGVQPYFLRFDEYKLTRFMACIGLIFLFGCGGEGGDSAPQQSTGNAPDTTPPNVSSTNPASGASGFSVNSAITATFSEEMDSTTITSDKFTITNTEGPVTGIVSYAGDTATFAPSASLSYSTTYTATITTGVRDLAGNQMASYTWTFTTSESGTATLTWDANSESDLAGYRVYYGTSPGIYLQAKGVGIDAGNNTTYTAKGLQVGSQYYFAVTAYDTLGNESDYSNEASKVIP